VRPDLNLDDAALLRECDVDTYRASGPGGQNRNKVETAVRLRHRPTGLMVIAEESRSQAENRVRAVSRLRKAIALKLRNPIEDDGVPEALRACFDGRGRLSVGQRDARYLPAIASLLDLLAAANGSVADVARRVGVTTANVSSLLTGDDDVFVEANRIRAETGQRPLRRT
jgi:hypothetical protein